MLTNQKYLKAEKEMYDEISAKCPEYQTEFFILNLDQFKKKHQPKDEEEKDVDKEPLKRIKRSNLIR